MLTRRTMREASEGNSRSTRRKRLATTKPRYSKEEFAQRGEAIYGRDIRPALAQRHEGDFVAIDIETGAFEVDADELPASDRLLARVPTAQIWLRRVGSRFARRFGPRGRSVAHREPAQTGGTEVSI